MINNSIFFADCISVLIENQITEESIWTIDASDMGHSIILFLTKRLELMKQIMVLNYGQVSISSNLGGFQIMNICSNIGVGILRM